MSPARPALDNKCSQRSFSSLKSRRLLFCCCRYWQWDDTTWCIRHVWWR